jgi:hypothetical protein
MSGSVALDISQALRLTVAAPPHRVPAKSLDSNHSPAQAPNAMITKTNPDHCEGLQEPTSLPHEPLHLLLQVIHFNGDGPQVVRYPAFGIDVIVHGPDEFGVLPYCQGNSSYTAWMSEKKSPAVLKWIRPAASSTTTRGMPLLNCTYMFSRKPILGSWG